MFDSEHLFQLFKRASKVLGLDVVVPQPWRMADWILVHYLSDLNPRQRDALMEWSAHIQKVHGARRLRDE